MWLSPHHLLLAVSRHFEEWIPRLINGTFVHLFTHATNLRVILATCLILTLPLSSNPFCQQVVSVLSSEYLWNRFISFLFITGTLPCLATVIFLIFFPANSWSLPVSPPLYALLSLTICIPDSLLGFQSHCFARFSLDIVLPLYLVNS